MRPAGSLPVFLLLWAAPATGQTVADAYVELRSGEYEDAERTFRRGGRGDATSLRAGLGCI